MHTDQILILVILACTVGLFLWGRWRHDIVAGASLLACVVEGLDDMMLAGLQNATSALGSLVLALALMEGRVSAEEAYAAAQLDETFQIEQWGEDAEATARRAALKADILATRRFLDLVKV